MKEIAILAIIIILAFIAFVILWNRKWRGNTLDEREANIRLNVRVMIARAVEIALIDALLFQFLVRPLTGLEALLTVGVAGILAEAFGNWYLRKDDLDRA